MTLFASKNRSKREQNRANKSRYTEIFDEREAKSLPLFLAGKKILDKGKKTLK